MSSNNPGKNKPNQNRVGIPVGTSKPKPTPGSGAAGSGTPGQQTPPGQPTPPPPPPPSSSAPYDPNAPLPPARPRRLDRTERIREVAQGSTPEASARRSAVGSGRAGATSKRALGVATPSAASRAAAARAARRRTNNQIRITLVVLAILVVGTVIVVGILGGNNSSNTTTTPTVADQTATAVAVSAALNSPTTAAPITPTITPTSAPTIPYPGGAPPTAAPIVTSTNITPGPIAINVDKGIADKTMTIITNRGTIVLDLYSNAAPNTVKNYETRANRGEYNGRTWHRVEDWVLQGNDPTGTGSGGGNIPTEINKLPFTVGSLGVARTADITYSNDSQLFIVKTADPTKYPNFDFLNGVFDPKTGVPTGGYTNFGHVVSGQDVVDKMQVGNIIYTIKVTNGAAPIPTIAPTAATTGSGTVTNTGTVTGTATVYSTTTMSSTVTMTSASTPTGTNSTATISSTATVTSTTTPGK